MIESVRFRGFKSLREVGLALERFTVLVGPNASGKTAVLEGIHLLTRAAAGAPPPSLEGSGGPCQLALQGTFGRVKGQVALELGSGPGAACRVQSSLGNALREATFLRLDPARLADPSYSDLPTPLLGADGAGLASVIDDLAGSRPDDFARLEASLSALIPGLARLRLRRAQVPRRGGDGRERVWGHELLLDLAGAPGLPARLASEGTLRIIGLLTALAAAPQGPRVVLVDHLERGPTPRALGELAGQLAQALALDPGLQIIATTDSPMLLDHLSAESVRVHCLCDDGSVRVKPLIAHPEWELLRHDLRPGEFWNEVGDEWVALGEA